MTEHDEHADRLEREAEDMERRSAQVGDEIAGAREDWERKQADDSVPGAVGRPASEDKMPPPEPDETD
jgi:hypothetical protein